MPAGNVFHEADALALHRVGQQQRRLARRGNVLRLLQAFDDLPDVVAIDLDDLPAEAAIALVQRLDVHHVLHPAVDLQPVAVDDAHQVVELVVRRLHHRFPDVAFLLLAVAHDAEHGVLLARPACPPAPCRRRCSGPVRASRSIPPRPAASAGADAPGTASTVCAA